ncbi:hypothetical protein GCM10020000_45570 [Streptomyces olivoverticillatus]
MGREGRRGPRGISAVDAAVRAAAAGTAPAPGRAATGTRLAAGGAADADPPTGGQLADATASRSRRRKLLMIGGGVLATGAVAAIVATAVVQSGKSGKKLPAAEKLPAASASPEPTFSKVAPPPPPNPEEFIASSDKDKAPLSTKTLFPHAKPVMSPKTGYTRAATDSTSDCASVGQNGLGAVLADNGCRQVLRATYVRDGVAVTVGVAVFDNKAAADKAKEQSTGNMAALAGDDGTNFCQGPACRLTANAEGRYTYFTVAGYTNGTAVTSDDTKALKAGHDVAGYTFRRIMARANAQASASVSSPKASSEPAKTASGSPKPSAAH